MALGSACLLLPAGSLGISSSPWCDFGTGDVNLGACCSSAARKHRLCRLPPASLQIPLSLASPSLQPRLVITYNPRMFIFHSFALYSLFSPRTVSPGRSSSHGVTPRSSLHGPRGAADDGSTLPSASPRAQHHAVEVPDGTKPTEKLSAGSQCCEAPKSQP